jgi:hypothetical protein
MINIQALLLKLKNTAMVQYTLSPKNHHPLQEVNQRSPAQRSVTQGNEQRAWHKDVLASPNALTPSFFFHTLTFATSQAIEQSPTPAL